MERLEVKTFSNSSKELLRFVEAQCWAQVTDCQGRGYERLLVGCINSNVMST
jgi:hypothetical protein